MTDAAAMALSVAAPGTLDGERLDRAVALLAGCSRALAGRLVDDGAVRIDGAVVRQRRRLLRSGQRLEIDVPPSSAALPTPDPAVEVRIVHEDADLLVVDKPAGLVVHHGAGQRGGTLVDGLLARYPELADLPSAGAGDPERPGIVHRLDKETSGLLVVARSAAAHRSLSEQFRQHRARRSYLALVHGVPEASAGLVDAPIGRSVRTPTRMAVTAAGRSARTRYQVQRRFAEPFPASLLRLELETGRTHQVRVHLAAIGHPVVGDDRYGGRSAAAPDLQAVGTVRQFLHACELTCSGPDGTTHTWRSSLPDDLQSVLDRFEPSAH